MNLAPKEFKLSERLALLCYVIVVSLALAPFMAFKLVSLVRGRGSLKELLGRFGSGPWLAIAALPPTSRFEPGLKRIWLHGASMGEVAGLAPIVRQLRVEYPASGLVLTTTSRAGQQELVRRELTRTPTYLPVDHPWFVAKVIRRVRPDLVIIAETELWPVLLMLLKMYGVPVLLVNARISDRTWPRYQKLRWLIAPALRNMRSVCAQTKQDAERLLSLGARAEAVQVNGSTKYEQSNGGSVVLRSRLREELKLTADAVVLVAGSTRPGEEQLLLECFSKLRSKFPQLKLVLAPRHAERFNEVEALVRSQAISCSKRSLGGDLSTSEVFLLDSIGELRSFYAAAELAFVGGTFGAYGGHNPFEPVACDVPLIIGPGYANFRDAVQQLIAGHGIRVAQNAQELERELAVLIGDAAARLQLVESARAVLQANQGATARVLTEVRKVIAAGSSA